MQFNRNLSNKYQLNRGLEALDLSTFNSSNQLVFNLADQKIKVNVNTPSATRTYTIPDIGTDGSFYISGGSAPNTGDLIPSANNTYDIGSSTYNWKNLYMEGVANLSSASNQIEFGGNLVFNVDTSGAGTIFFPKCN